MWSREKPKNLISRYIDLERDSLIVACMFLCQACENPCWAEIGGLALHKNFNKVGSDDAMLGLAERMAHNKGVRYLFSLSTQRFDWFYKHGFSEVSEVSVLILPLSRQKQ